MTRILCDLGGTHIRFGISDRSGAVQAPLRFSARDFSGFVDAVSHYTALQGVCAHDGILLASTGPLSRPWPPVSKGLKILGEVSDFEASAWGAPYLAGDQLVTVRAGAGDEGEPRVILGPGTGLGLAYMLPVAAGEWRIQKTHGGHMQAALATEEHMLLADMIARQKGTGHTIIYENFSSGRFLPLLYRAVCQMLGEDAGDVDSAEDFLKCDGGPAFEATLRVFHEMLGLFAHHCILTLNAFGGLYLDGGMVQRLREQDLFDAETLLQFMTLNPVATVRADLDRTPVWVVNDPFIALRGLAAMDRDGIFEGEAK